MNKGKWGLNKAKDIARAKSCQDLYAVLRIREFILSTVEIFWRILRGKWHYLISVSNQIHGEWKGLWERCGEMKKNVYIWEK